MGVGDAFPDFDLPATGDKRISLMMLRGRRVVFYFYPRDNTPGCSAEALAFAQIYDSLTQHNVLVYGVSRDSVASHERFKQKLALPFELLSDAQATLCSAVGIMKVKNMYGRRVMGIERTTFLVDEQGLIRHIWPRVRVEGHVAAVERAVDALDPLTG
jgi:peroxiredoxin Q/BCP